MSAEKSSRLFQHQLALSKPTAKRGSFEIVYRNLALPLKKFLTKRMSGDQHAVEEVFSRTVSAAWQGWHTFRHKSSYFTWLCRIALNKMADYYRDQVNDNSRWILPVLEELAQAPTNELTPLEKLSLQELQSAMGECLNQLPPKARELMQFRFWRQLTLKEISVLTGSSERAVEGKIYRAKQLLKQILRDRYPELVPAPESSNSH